MIFTPFPITGLDATGPALLDLACELRAKPITPEPDCFVADVDPSLVQ